MLRECMGSGAARAQHPIISIAIGVTWLLMMVRWRDAMRCIRAHSAGFLPCHARHALESAENAEIFNRGPTREQLMVIRIFAKLCADRPGERHDCEGSP